MNIAFNNTRFIKGAHELSQCLPDSGYEVAFAGRSNAGKSSALNVITGIDGLARTSKQPGRTQQINFFELAETRYLVDLPGYGFAKVSPAIRQHWDKTLTMYFEQRKSLKGLIVIMDVRHPLKELDLQLIEWVNALDIPIHCLLTKSDKLGKGKASAVLAKVRKELKNTDEQIGVQLFSSLDGRGIEQARTKIREWLTV